jgi:hypothetical protein
LADERLFEERGNALEEEFFRKHNAELLARLRESKSKDEARELMAAASGIRNEAVLDQLIAHGMSPATVAALALAPLVAVAWADRKLEEKERRAVLAEAAEAGVSEGSPGFELLQSWLNQAPPPALLTTWSDYARELAGGLDGEQRREFRETLVRRARGVATAAGGFAGVGSKVSGAEQEVLDTIESALPA